MAGGGAGANITLAVAFVDFTGPATVILIGMFTGLVVALTVTPAVAETAPESQGTVVGKPEIRIELLEKVHDEPLSTIADSVTVPPLKGTGSGLERKSDTFGLGGAAATVTVVAADDAESDPSAVSTILIFLLTEAKLAATVTIVEAVPALQLTVVGRPVTDLAVVEKVHSDALNTSAESITEPPVYGSDAGLAE
jgi:hypothetical protein